MFVRKKDPLMETWNGRRLGIEKAPETLNVDSAFAIEDISRVLQKKRKI
ncbi:Xaa-Pro aminopeptidase [Actinobacillus equuli]|nr:Xaa-Pro aminopeptidase [Actinobacillus equuli]